MDFYLGKILEALKSKGLLDKTIIIIAGDHGEGLGIRWKEAMAYSCMKRQCVPLIIWNKKYFQRKGW